MNKKNMSGILFDLIILFLGVCLILWADKATSLVSIILGILISLYGVINIVNYFKAKDKLMNDTMRFIYGILILVLGGVLIFRVNFLKELISFIVGIYIILASAIKLHNYFVIKKSNSSNKLISSLVLSIIGLVIGIFCIVGKFIISDFILVVIGYVLVIYSLIDISNTFILGKENGKSNITKTS